MRWENARTEISPANCGLGLQEIEADAMLLRAGVLTEKEIRKRRAKQAGSPHTGASRPGSTKAAARLAQPTVDATGTEHGSLATRPGSPRRGKAASARPFSVVVVKLSHGFVGWAAELRAHVKKCNTGALRLTHLALDEQDATLQAFTLSRLRGTNLSI
jgi:hypothetical protein